jgi:hypothetical protein
VVAPWVVGLRQCWGGRQADLALSLCPSLLASRCAWM